MTLFGKFSIITYFLKNSIRCGFGCSIISNPWTCDEDSNTSCRLTILLKIRAE